MKNKEQAWIEQMQADYKKTHPYKWADLKQDAWMFAGGLLMLGYLIYSLCQLILRVGA